MDVHCNVSLCMHVFFSTGKDAILVGACLRKEIKMSLQYCV